MNHVSLPDEGFVRLRSIIAPHGVLGVGRSHWYEGITKGIYPAPHKIGKCSVWSVADIRSLLERIEDGSFSPQKRSKKEASDARAS